MIMHRSMRQAAKKVQPNLAPGSAIDPWSSEAEFSVLEWVQVGRQGTESHEFPGASLRHPVTPMTNFSTLDDGLTKLTIWSTKHG